MKCPMADDGHDMVLNSSGTTWECIGKHGSSKSCVGMPVELYLEDTNNWCSLDGSLDSANVLETFKNDIVELSVEDQQELYEHLHKLGRRIYK